jgi:hypothetical protein
MSNKKARVKVSVPGARGTLPADAPLLKERPEIREVPSPNGHRQTLAIGPETRSVFSQVLTQTDISKAQILTLLEAKGLIGTGNYRLAIVDARLEPIE